LLEISERLYQSYAKVPSAMDHVRWLLNLINKLFY
jgi:hypothetical protein